MKIIGTTAGRGQYLVSASDDELARVAGHPYGTQLRESMRRDIQIGDDIEVDAMYDRLKGIRACEKRLIEAQATLRAVADLIGPVASYIAQANDLGIEDTQA